MKQKVPNYMPSFASLNFPRGAGTDHPLSHAPVAQFCSASRAANVASAEKGKELVRLEQLPFAAVSGRPNNLVPSKCAKDESFPHREVFIGA